ncbi:MAG: collagen-like protein [Microbacteriaceae bacterium]
MAISPSRLKKSILAASAAVGLVLGGSAFAQGASELNTTWGGYVVCVDKTTGDMNLRWAETCPVGSTTKVFGARGMRGFTGATGATGATGPAGADGIDGINGTNGVDGAPGANGTNGLDGAPGSNGTNGVDGMVGPQGPAGADATQDFIFFNADDFAGPAVQEVYTAGYRRDVLVLPPGTNTASLAPLVIPTTWKSFTYLKMEVFYRTTSDASTQIAFWVGLEGRDSGATPDSASSVPLDSTPDGTSGIQVATRNIFATMGSFATSPFFELYVERSGSSDSNTGDIQVLGVKLSPITNLCPANFNRAAC